MRISAPATDTRTAMLPPPLIAHTIFSMKPCLVRLELPLKIGNCGVPRRKRWGTIFGEFSWGEVSLRSFRAFWMFTILIDNAIERVYGNPITVVTG